MFEKNSVNNKVMAYGGDGVFDIVLGLSMMVAGAYIYFDLISLAAIVAIIAMLAAQGLKRTITVPRLSEIELPDDVNVRMFRGFVLSTLLLGVFFLVGVTSYLVGRNGVMPEWLSTWLDSYLPITLLAIVILFLAVGSYATRNLRMVGYGVLMAVAMAVGLWMDIVLWQGLVMLGVIITVIGLLLLWDFIRTHPILPPDQRLQFQ